MTTSSYSSQLHQLYKVDGLGRDAETIRMLLEEIEKGEARVSLLKKAAALAHAQSTVRQIRENIYDMRRELKGQGTELGVQNWRLGIR